MKVKEIYGCSDPASALSELLNTLHAVGPSSSDILESISYYKLFHPAAFATFEEKIITALGLFYKNKEPDNVYSFLMAGFGHAHNQTYGSYLTPVQASIRRAVDDSQFISISAPTSAGKSYSIRDFIAEQDGDAVVVVPSRALIAEYVNSMKRKFAGDKNVMVSSFVDCVYNSRQLRRIFVLTPERARELFSIADTVNIQVFFFDEAQVSEEVERGVVFDVMVRRVRKHFPAAKLIFAHPFVENPEAQFTKHGLGDEDSFAKSYSQGAVGKIPVFHHSNAKDYYFSPYIEQGHHVNKCVQFPEPFEKFAFNGEHTVLVYVSKASIYNGKFVDGFKKYIDRFEVVDSGGALAIIETIESLLGADSENQESDFVNYLKKGVVIHHGSVPLEVRFLVEDFIRQGFSKICFATSTLAQGINMPFDIVWLENTRVIGGSELERALSFKNLIGRSGRLSEGKSFDFGYVYTKNAALFARRINSEYTLHDTSIIEDDEREILNSEDFIELLDSIRNDTFDDDKNLPKSKVERLKNSGVLEASKRLLDILFKDDTIKKSIGGSDNRSLRNEATSCLIIIFEASLGRSLYEGELAVFQTAISIFFLLIQGASFKEIAGLRYSRISNRDSGRRGRAGFSQPANKLPDSSLKNRYSLFDIDTPARQVPFDAIIYDTYDYLDTVISYSLSEVFTAAFKIYSEHTGDGRSSNVIELLRYGTNDPDSVLLIRYGIPPEEVPALLPYVDFIDENTIIFNREIQGASPHIKQLAEWYLP